MLVRSFFFLTSWHSGLTGQIHERVFLSHIINSNGRHRKWSYAPDWRSMPWLSIILRVNLHWRLHAGLATAKFGGLDLSREAGSLIQSLSINLQTAQFRRASIWKFCSTMAQAESHLSYPGPRLWGRLVWLGVFLFFQMTSGEILDWHERVNLFFSDSPPRSPYCYKYCSGAWCRAGS